MQYLMGFCTVVCLSLGLPILVFGETSGNGSEKVVELAKVAEAVTVMRRDVYNMTPAQGQLLLTSGRMQALLSPSDDVGTPRVSCPETSEQSGVSRPLASNSGSGSGSGS